MIGRAAGYKAVACPVDDCGYRRADQRPQSHDACCFNESPPMERQPSARCREADQCGCAQEVQSMMIRTTSAPSTVSVECRSSSPVE